MGREWEDEEPGDIGWGEVNDTAEGWVHNDDTDMVWMGNHLVTREEAIRRYNRMTRILKIEAALIVLAIALNVILYVTL